MGVRQQMGDPWGIVTAVLVGGLGGAVTAALAPTAALALPVGLAIAGGVYAVKVGVGTLVSRSAAGTGTPGLPEPPRGSAAQQWLARAEVALQALRRQTGTPPDAALAAQIEDVDDQAAGVVADLRRLAGQVTVVEQALSGIDGRRLGQRANQLRVEAANSVGALHDEKQRAVRAVEDQLSVFERLAQARATQLARMESTVLGLEGLAARLAEVIALRLSSDAGGSTAGRLVELNSDLDGLRAGLAEAEELSRTALAAAPGEASGGGGPGGVR